MKLFKSIRMGALASALGGLAAFTLVACGGGGSSSTTASSTSASAPTTLDVKLGAMTVDAPKSIPAGPTKVTVVNQDSVEHEVVFLRTDTPAAKVPVDKKTGEASEKDAVGEVADLAQSQSGSTTINFKPGHYAIVCNVPGHYKAGMYTDMEVTKD